MTWWRFSQAGKAESEDAIVRAKRLGQSTVVWVMWTVRTGPSWSKHQSSCVLGGVHRFTESAALPGHFASDAMSPGSVVVTDQHDWTRCVVGHVVADRGTEESAQPTLAG
jgi:hypothetical protein